MKGLENLSPTHGISALEEAKTENLLGNVCANPEAALELCSFVSKGTSQPDSPLDRAAIGLQGIKLRGYKP